MACGVVGRFTFRLLRPPTGCLRSFINATDDDGASPSLVPLYALATQTQTTWGRCRSHHAHRLSPPPQNDKDNDTPSPSPGLSSRMTQWGWGCDHHHHHAMTTTTTWQCDNEVASSSPTLSIPLHATMAPHSRLIPPHTTTTTWPPPCPHHVLTHLPPHTTVKTVPYLHLALTHITRPSTCDHNSASLLPHPSIYDDDNDMTSPSPSSHPHPPPSICNNNNDGASPSSCPHSHCPSLHTQPWWHLAFALPLPTAPHTRIWYVLSQYPYPLTQPHYVSSCVYALRVVPSPAPPRLVPPHAMTMTVPRPHLAPTSSVPPHAMTTVPRPRVVLIHCTSCTCTHHACACPASHIPASPGAPTPYSPSSMAHKCVFHQGYFTHMMY